MSDIPMIGDRPMYYRLTSEHEVVPASRAEALALFESIAESRRVALDQVGDARVSTVFLSLDHGFGGGPPLVFESMVFGGEHHEAQWRYSTWQEAVDGHAAIVAALREGRDPADAG